MDVSWMVAPAAACLVMALALGWFGFHVLQRGVIFVDLALAQIAALGTTWAVTLGHAPDEPVAYLHGLVFTVLGAAAFSLARRFESRVPQEALIGIAYAVSAGLGALLLDFASDPHGAEKLQHLMVGNVVWVTWNEIGAMAAVCGAVGVVHALFREPLLSVSLDPQGSEARGLPVGVWDLVFYLSFGVVVTTIVHVAGVLLVFSWLVIPAVIARLFVDGVVPRLLVAYGVSIPVSLVGVAVSYEHATGPIVVGLLGLCLVVALAAFAVVHAADRRRTAAVLGAAGAVLAALLWGLSEVEVGEHEHETAAGRPLLPDANARDAYYRANAGQPEVLAQALAREEDASLRLLLGTLLLRAGDARGLAILADLASSEVPFVRLEADGALRTVLPGRAPAFDPLAGPDTDGRWRAALADPPPDWVARATALPPP